jgi:WhiB family redox-sensing transcriptional regulator
MDEELDDEYELPEFTFLVIRPKWMQQAACRGLDASLFFPERGEVVSDEAREICAECPVCRECLEFSIITKERDGVWGGKSGRQRRDMRSQAIDRTYTRTCIECGDRFQGNYRSKICGPDCRRKRNAMVRHRHKENDDASEDGD